MPGECIRKLYKWSLSPLSIFLVSGTKNKQDSMVTVKMLQLGILQCGHQNEGFNKMKTTTRSIFQSTLFNDDKKSIL